MEGGKYLVLHPPTETLDALPPTSECALHDVAPDSFAVGKVAPSIRQLLPHLALRVIAARLSARIG